MSFKLKPTRNNPYPIEIKNEIDNKPLYQKWLLSLNTNIHNSIIESLKYNNIQIFIDENTKDNELKIFRDIGKE
jgi:hypothetical protein